MLSYSTEYVKSLYVNVLLPELDQVETIGNDENTYFCFYVRLLILNLRLNRVKIGNLKKNEYLRALPNLT